MLPSTFLARVAATVAAAATIAIPAPALASPGHGVTFTTLSGLPQTFADPDQIISEQIKVGTKDATTVRIQSAVWEAGSDSGWHHHPGVIMGIVTSGSVTVWSPTCGMRTYGPGLSLGAVFLEGGNELMKATSSAGATEYIVHIFPVGAAPRGEDDVPPCATALGFRTLPTKR